MNYIKQLQEQNLELSEKLNNIESSINDILRYINSSKFHANESDRLNNYVNVGDMNLRLQEVKQIF